MALTQKLQSLLQNSGFTEIVFEIGFPPKVVAKYKIQDLADLLKDSHLASKAVHDCFADCPIMWGALEGYTIEYADVNLRKVETNTLNRADELADMKSRGFHHSALLRRCNLYAADARREFEHEKNKKLKIEKAKAAVKTMREGALPIFELLTLLLQNDDPIKVYALEKLAIARETTGSEITAHELQVRGIS